MRLFGLSLLVLILISSSTQARWHHHHHQHHHQHSKHNNKNVHSHNNDSTISEPPQSSSAYPPDDSDDEPPFFSPEPSNIPPTPADPPVKSYIVPPNPPSEYPIVPVKPPVKSYIVPPSPEPSLTPPNPPSESSIVPVKPPVKSYIVPPISAPNPPSESPIFPVKPPVKPYIEPPSPEHPLLPPNPPSESPIVPAKPPVKSYIEPPSPEPAPEPANDEESGVLDVRKFGAIGDGKADDTDAFKLAWETACQKNDSSVILVPYGFKFMIQSTIFTGPCLGGLVLQLDGTIMPPDGPEAWPEKNSKRQWLVFYRVNEMALVGGGVIDGRGQKWWDLPCKPHKPHSNPHVHYTYHFPLLIMSSIPATTNTTGALASSDSIMSTFMNLFNITQVMTIMPGTFHSSIPHIIEPPPPRFLANNA